MKINVNNINKRYCYFLTGGTAYSAAYSGRYYQNSPAGRTIMFASLKVFAPVPTYLGNDVVFKIKTFKFARKYNSFAASMWKYANHKDVYYRDFSSELKIELNKVITEF